MFAEILVCAEKMSGSRGLPRHPANNGQKYDLFQDMSQGFSWKTADTHLLPGQGQKQKKSLLLAACPAVKAWKKGIPTHPQSMKNDSSASSSVSFGATASAMSFAMAGVWMRRASAHKPSRS